MIEIDCKTGEITEMKDDVVIDDISNPIDYEQEIINRIRQKYSIDDELAIQRQRDTKPSEFDEYFQYCEQCKNEVKKLMEVNNGQGI